MLIVGAKGFAKEVLETIYNTETLNNLVFFDDVNKDIPDKLFNKFPIIKSLYDAQEYFNTVDKKFTLGLGNPILRKRLMDKFIALNAILTTTISKNAVIGNYDVEIGNGTNILDNAIISNSVSIGICCIVYFNSIITHDVKVGNFVEISPGAKLLGRSSVGNYSQIGSNSVILPDIVVGNNVIVGAGAVVTKNVPDNSVVSGVPAVIKRKLEPLKL